MNFMDDFVQKLKESGRLPIASMKEQQTILLEIKKANEEIARLKAENQRISVENDKNKHTV